MESQRKSQDHRSTGGSGSSEEYLRPVTFGDSEEVQAARYGHDAGSQAWGDYLEEIEGFEI